MKKLYYPIGFNFLFSALEAVSPYIQTTVWTEILLCCHTRRNQPISFDSCTPRPACPKMQGCIIHVEQELVKIISILCNYYKGSFVGASETLSTLGHWATLGQQSKKHKSSTEDIHMAHILPTPSSIELVHMNILHLIKCISRAGRN